MAHHSNLIPPTHETLLNTLSDLQTDHSDFLRHLSSDLHGAASLINSRAQELEGAACRSRKEAWESGVQVAWEGRGSAAEECDDMARSEIRVDAEMRSGARDVEYGWKLRDVVSELIGGRCEDIKGRINRKTDNQVESHIRTFTFQHLSVYDKLKLSNTGAEVDGLDLLYDLTASKLAHQQAHTLAQQGRGRGSHRIQRMRHSFFSTKNNDELDRVQTFIRDQELVPSNKHNDSNVTFPVSGERSSRFIDPIEGSDNETTDLSEDDSSSTGNSCDEPITPSTLNTEDMKIDTEGGDLDTRWYGHNTWQSKAQVDRDGILLAAGRCNDAHLAAIRDDKVIRWDGAD